MAASVERRAACGASYNACASGATRQIRGGQPARPAGKARADRQFQRRVGRRGIREAALNHERKKFVSLSRAAYEAKQCNKDYGADEWRDEPTDQASG